MEWNYKREYFTKHIMHLSRRDRGLISKQAASEILDLSATEEIPPISLGWSMVQEQIVQAMLWCLKQGRQMVIVLITNELKIVPDKIAAEGKYVVDYPIDEPKTEPDKPRNSATKAIRASKRLKKSPVTKKNDFFMVKEKCSE
jgi:hypothetical protein